MLQRASLCRALIHEPKLLLLDEPFGALDQFTREELWSIMQQLWMEKKPTVILVTHDLREACFLSNRIYMMSARPGKVLDIRDVGFARPRTLDLTYSSAFVEIMHDLRMQIADARSQPIKEVA
jgi:NitT/TauT family transport system ATP-binding protein